MTKNNRQQIKLSDAPKSIQLAVDLIQLLEENKIETQTAIEALEIVLNDFKKKRLSKITAIFKTATFRW
ncbi:YbaM family protein [Psychromonas sp. MME2]|uniref:YbaM family protein n=1 Tax=Psychromonas sp. MME2 TaxID=3231033 RepID=UPI00339C3DC1